MNLQIEVIFDEPGIGSVTRVGNWLLTRIEDGSAEWEWFIPGTLSEDRALKRAGATMRAKVANAEFLKLTDAMFSTPL